MTRTPHPPCRFAACAVGRSRSARRARSEAPAGVLVLGVRVVGPVLGPPGRELSFEQTFLPGLCQQVRGQADIGRRLFQIVEKRPGHGKILGQVARLRASVEAAADDMVGKAPFADEAAGIAGIQHLDRAIQRNARTFGGAAALGRGQKDGVADHVVDELHRMPGARGAEVIAQLLPSSPCL